MTAIPKRSTQGSPVTSLQHDTLHNDMATEIATLQSQIAGLVSGSGVPTGVVLYTASSNLDVGFLWANGSEVSRTTYASLFARIGIVFGAGDGTTTFLLPDTQGRVIVGAGAGAGLTNRILGQYFGAETYHDTRSFTITNQPVTATVPSMTVSFSNMGSVTFPTFSAGTKDTLTFSAGTKDTLTFSAGTKDTLTFSAGTKDTLTFSAGAQGTLSGGATPTFPTWSVAGTGGAPGLIPLVISAPTAVYGSDVATHSVVVPTITGTVSSTAIAATLNLSSSGGSVGSLQTLSAGTAPSASLSGYVAPSASLSGYVAPSASLSGYVAPSASLSGYVAPSSTGGTNTVSGAAATTPSTSITGATVSGSTVAANTQIAIMQPSVVLNGIIKI